MFVKLMYNEAVNIKLPTIGGDDIDLAVHAANNQDPPTQYGRLTIEVPRGLRARLEFKNDAYFVVFEKDIPTILYDGTKTGDEGEYYTITREDRKTPRGYATISVTFRIAFYDGQESWDLNPTDTQGGAEQTIMRHAAKYGLKIAYIRPLVAVEK